jgi:hypothetical protein
MTASARDWRRAGAAVVRDKVRDKGLVASLLCRGELRERRFRPATPKARPSRHPPRGGVVGTKEGESALPAIIEHYHLLVETPRGNIDRFMGRHVV